MLSAYLLLFDYDSGLLAGRMEIFPHLVVGGNLFADAVESAMSEACGANTMAMGTYESEEDEAEVIDEDPDNSSDDDEMFGDAPDKNKAVALVEDGFRCPYVVTTTCLNVFFKVTGTPPNRCGDRWSISHADCVVPFLCCLQASCCL